MRDVLSGQINEVDERRLWGEEEFKRRWEAREGSPSVETARSGSPRDGRRFALNTTIPSSVNEALRGFISSNTARAVSATPLADHNRLASSGTRVTLPTRVPVRVSASNAFQRVPDSGNGTHAPSVAQNRTVVGSDASPAGVQQDPLGVLR